MADGEERQTQAQRSASTRAKLARAAFDQLRLNGYAQFRTATVARNAGVSQGGQLHHFPTKEALALAAIEHAYDSVQRATADSLARHDRANASAIDTLRALLDDCMAFYFSSTFDVALDVVKGAAGNVALRRQIAQLSRSYRGYTEQAWQTRFAAHGLTERDAIDLIDLSTALVRGFAIRRWIHKDSGQFKRLLDRWVELVAVGVPSLAPAPRQLRALRGGGTRAARTVSPRRVCG